MFDVKNEKEQSYIFLLPIWSVHLKYAFGVSLDLAELGQYFALRYDVTALQMRTQKDADPEQRHGLWF